MYTVGAENLTFKGIVYYFLSGAYLDIIQGRNNCKKGECIP